MKLKHGIQTTAAVLALLAPLTGEAVPLITFEVPVTVKDFPTAERFGDCQFRVVCTLTGNNATSTPSNWQQCRSWQDGSIVSVRLNAVSVDVARVIAQRTGGYKCELQGKTPQLTCTHSNCPTRTSEGTTLLFQSDTNPFQPAAAQ